MTERRNPADARRRRSWLAAVAVAALALTGAAAASKQSRALSERQQLPQRASGAHAFRPAQSETPRVNIKNFGVVNENYYRGSQPGPEEFAELKRFGVKTVIDLREDYKRHAPAWVREQGMRYFNIPLKASRPATEQETQYFLQLVNDPANWPVYVHCKGGRHRTGALTAVYRITHDRWTADQAFEEMLRYDFNHGGFFSGGGGRARQKKFVYDFYEQFSHQGAQR